MPRASDISHDCRDVNFKYIHKITAAKFIKTLKTMQNSCLEIVPNSSQYNILKLILAVSITCSKLANLSGNFVTATSKQNLPSILRLM